MKYNMKTGAKASFLVLSVAMLFSCGRTSDKTGLEYAPGMYHPVAYEPLKQLEENGNSINPGGLDMREPAKGSIARGKMAYYTHIDKDSAEEAGRTLRNPLEVTEANLAEGKVLYTRICSHCHGEAGAGDGLVGQKFKGVPNFQGGRYATLPQGHIYHVITNGRGRMMPHGSIVNPEERWKISLYVQQLQNGGQPALPGPEQGSPGQGATETMTPNQVTGSNQNPQDEPDAGN